MIRFCVDSTNVNFGGKVRARQNVLFCQLNQAIPDSNMVGVGCAAHIVGNRVQTAADRLPLDTEAFVVKIYKRFHIYTVWF